ncbi:MAG TPA: hypothetical protein VFH78_08015 [Candidatus Thermoplasmatota archaeon]|nr:hypothetical protein [Candidatus Thermoplasmatota archaeon]
MLRTATLVAALAVALAAAPAPAQASDESHLFTLNLVGKERPMPVPGHDGGHRILVPLWGECRIDLSEGDFGTTDSNCTDNGRAGFRLPNPDPESDGVSAYRVYVRALGQPGGSATLNTCVEDNDGTWCSTETVVVARVAGQSPSMDVSRETLTVCSDRDGDGTVERETIFSDENADYFWKYTNSGLRLAQLKFVAGSADIGGPCPAV